MLSWGASTFLDESCEAMNRAVEGVDQKLGERRELRGTAQQQQTNRERKNPYETTQPLPPSAPK